MSALSTMSALPEEQPSIWASSWQRLRTGDAGVLPISAVLVIIWLVFQVLNPHFLSSDNMVNITQQSASTGVIALGVVLTLHIGQIDLSVGAVSGLAAAVVAVCSVQLGWAFPLAFAASLAVGVVVGSIYAALQTRLAVPSFVFTLAGLLVVTGLQIRVLGPTGSVNVPFESPLVEFCQTAFLDPALSWALVLLVVAGYSAGRLMDRTRRARAELPVSSAFELVTRVAVLAVVLSISVAYLNTNRGVGAVFALFVGLVAVVDLLLRRTRWGRSVRAVGGDVEAARKAGVPVRRVFFTVFVLCSTFAALGGVLAVGRLAAANQGTGASDTNLTAIAAAIIGGTSLFGGRGSAWSALVGILVIQSIATGLTLLNLDTSARLVVTGLVLALAVTIDALQARARESYRAVST